MPAKSKFKPEDIIDAAFHVVRTQGAEKCSARAIAHELHSSTMPIYSCTKSMKELEEAVVKKAIDVLIQYETQDRTGISALDMGLGYILFAKKERHLFRMLFIAEGREYDAELSTRLKDYAFRTLLEKLNEFEPLNDLTREQKEDILHKMWVFNHGLAVMLNNSVIEDLNEEDIIALLMDMGMYVMVGVRDRDRIFSQENVQTFHDIVSRKRNGIE